MASFSLKDILTNIAVWIKAPKRTEATGTDAFFRAENSDTNVAVSFGVGSGGTNHGLWSHKLGKWLIYGNDTEVRVNGNASGSTVISGNTYHSDNIYMLNAKAIFGKTTDGTFQNALSPCNSSNACVLGWGGYENSVGSTTICGNTIYLTSKGNISVNQPIFSGGYRLFTIEFKNVDNISVSANSYKEGSLSIAKTGFTPIGVLDYYASNASSSGTGSSFAMIYHNYIDRSNNTYHYGIRNVNSSAIKVKMNARILYVSATQGV